jgi:hypothetical protein
MADHSQVESKREEVNSERERARSRGAFWINKKAVGAAAAGALLGMWISVSQLFFYERYLHKL